MVFELVEDLLNETDKPILGIGIGTPGLVDTSTGVVIRSINLDWINLPLGQLLSERYGLPVYVANDSQVAALAQYLYGEGPKSPNLVTIKLGQGIGSGIVLAGKLFQGDGYGAGEIGHITIVENGRLCRCGNRGCLETVATERAIVQKVRETALVDAKSSLFNQTSSPDTISAEMVFQAYQAGDALVRGVVREAAHYLGIALANLVGALNLQHIWLTGGITRYGQTWLEQIRSEMRRRSLAALANDTQVDISSLSQDVVILGTSALLLTRELGLDLTR
jgi:glucokinase-like ROK family protein